MTAGLPLTFISSLMLILIYINILILIVLNSMETTQRLLIFVKFLYTFAAETGYIKYMIL